jgi:RNA polymerase sigma-70 factor (ECF subfamily)
MERLQPGPYQIKAAIADCHMAEPGPDWPQIAALYFALWRHEPTPIVSLNAAVAIAEAGDPTHGLAIIEGLEEQLRDYQPWHAARAAMLGMTGDKFAAAQAYRRAIAMAPTAPDALFLEQRLADIETQENVQPDA